MKNVEIQKKIEIIRHSLGETNSKPEGKTFYIATLCFGAHPGGGDYRRYILEELGGDRLSWYLWGEGEDELADAVLVNEEEEEWEKPLIYGLQAFVHLEKPVTPTEAAAELLRACWALEWAEYGPPYDFFVHDDSGILTSEDLTLIKAESLPED